MGLHNFLEGDCRLHLKLLPRYGRCVFAATDIYIPKSVLFITEREREQGRGYFQSRMSTCSDVDSNSTWKRHILTGLEPWAQVEDPQSPLDVEKQFGCLRVAEAQDLGLTPEQVKALEEAAQQNHVLDRSGSSGSDNSDMMQSGEVNEQADEGARRAALAEDLEWWNHWAAAQPSYGKPEALGCYPRNGALADAGFCLPALPRRWRVMKDWGGLGKVRGFLRTRQG